MCQFATKTLHVFFVTFFKTTMITFSNSYFSDRNWIWIVFVYLPKHKTVFPTQNSANIVYTSKRLCFQVLGQRFPLSQLSNFVSNHAGKTGITILFYLNYCMRVKRVSSLEFITHRTIIQGGVQPASIWPVGATSIHIWLKWGFILQPRIDPTAEPGSTAKLSPEELVCRQETSWAKLQVKMCQQNILKYILKHQGNQFYSTWE